MNRAVVVAATVAALVAAVVVTWMDVRREREFRRLIAVGDAAVASDQTFEAIEAFSGARALKPDSMLPYLKRGDTYRRRGDFTAAARDLQQAARFDTTAPQPVELLGDVHMATGHYDRAAEQYRRYISFDDRAPRVLYKLALAYHRGGQSAAAIDSLRRALAIDDRLSEAYYLLALCLRDRNNTGEATRALTRAVALDPGFATARQQLADLYTAVGRRREALEQLDTLAALEPMRADVMVHTALTYSRLGRFDAAVAALTHAQERFPSDSSITGALGRVLLNQSESTDDRGARRRAIDVLRPAASQQNALGDVLTLYGRALLLDNQLVPAERALQQATLRLPVDPSAFRDLATAARRLGHMEVSREALAEYFALGGDQR